MMNERPERYDLPRPAVRTALPVGVRGGDLLLIGTGDYDMSIGVREVLVATLRQELGVEIKVLFVPGATGVTVLRPEWW
jgi:hypothetical protein